MSLARSKEADYAEILQLDGLGLEEQKKRNKGKIYQELTEKLEKSKQGWYKTSIFWKINSDELKIPVIQELTESAKFQIVFDASARERNLCMTFKNVVKVGPALWNNK